MKNIIIFATGSGSNAESIIEYSKKNSSFKISAILTNKSTAGVINRAINHQIPYFIFSKEDFQNESFLKLIESFNADLIVLAGFLLKIPEYLVKKFPNKIINIHPALLPKYGGKGMYGMNIHNTVFENNELESGMTIHFVNENYDEGNIIFQESVSVTDCNSPEEIAKKVLALEHKNYPIIIDNILNN